MSNLDTVLLPNLFVFLIWEKNIMSIYNPCLKVQTLKSWHKQIFVSNWIIKLLLIKSTNTSRNSKSYWRTVRHSPSSFLSLCFSLGSLLYSSFTLPYHIFLLFLSFFISITQHHSCFSLCFFFLFSVLKRIFHCSCSTLFWIPNLMFLL